MKYIAFLTGVVLLAVAVFAAMFVPAAWTSKPAANAPSLTVSIASTSTATMVADALVEKGVLTTTLGYRVYSAIDSAARHPKAGSYTVQPGMSYRTLARLFFFGMQREEMTVKVIEGWTLVDEANMISNLGVTMPKPRAADWVSEYAFLADAPDDATLEGYLFPDTYRVWKDQLPEGLIKKQLDEFQKQTDGYAAEAKKQGRSFHDVVTLASIVQKEVADKSEMKVVAGIFWNRLQNGMPLQSDATVNYVTQSGRSRATAEDLKIESPYNTYLHRGLPPGPVSNPGSDALEAALHPLKTPYFYFLTDENGKLYLAKTLEEHARNRRKAFGS